MIKYLLFGVYAFSVIYCYMQLMAKIQECIDMFSEKHPEIPIKKSDAIGELWLQLKLIFISAIPFLNIFLAYFLEHADMKIIEDVVSEVESRYTVEFSRQNDEEEYQND